MIKINKDLTSIPDSLKPPTSDFFHPPAKIPRASKTTHNRRLEIINAGKYIDDRKYHSRYKAEDVKAALKSIYHNKCAFCEQWVEMRHIEHYRPKKGGYHWLAYSWDNLLIACPMCNIHKGNNFEITGTKASYINDNESIKNIHTSRSALDAAEKPKLVNPETTDPHGKIKFTETGAIDSDDQNLKYTIDTCKLSRSDLRDRRRKIIDDFRKDVAFIFSVRDPKDQETAISTIVTQFINRAKNVHEDFSAFRNYVISKNWLSKIVKELN